MGRFQEMVAGVAIDPDKRKSHYSFAKYMRHLDRCDGGGDQFCDCGMAQLYWNIDQLLDDAEAAHHVLQGCSVQDAYKKVGERLTREARASDQPSGRAVNEVGIPMTQDELDRIRDVTELNCAIFQREEDVAVTDAEGNWWLLGVLNGERVKRRMGFFGGYKSMQGPSDNE